MTGDLFTTMARAFLGSFLWADFVRPIIGPAVGGVIGYWVGSRLEKRKERRNTSRELEYYRTTATAMPFPKEMEQALEGLKQFFLRNSELLQVADNRKFFDDWLGSLATDNDGLTEVMEFAASRYTQSPAPISWKRFQDGLKALTVKRSLASRRKGFKLFRRKSGRVRAK